MNFSLTKQGSRRRPFPAAALGIALAVCGLRVLALGQQNATEDQVKAAYLLNFAKLGEWPPSALPEGASALVLGVRGGDAQFLDVLKAVAGGKLVGGHPVVIKLVASADMKTCHIVFFRESEKRHVQAEIAGLAQTGILLVGEDELFLDRGGMIDLVRDHGSIRFQINANALDRSQIHFSAKIMALARADYDSRSELPSSSQLETSRRLEQSSPPEYPALAERMKLTGTVQVQALVNPDGTVKDVKIIGGHPLLADALVRAVKLWKYQPGPKETAEVVKYTFSPH